jgi:glycosyltransferase involved in cell wall biosynthesis
LGSGGGRDILRFLRICLVYDCLYPHTVGGAERTYRDLAGRLVAAGHEVTYLTLRQWPRGESGDFDGVRVVAVGPQRELYVAGRRRIAPPLIFGAGVLRHLLVHGGRYDVVHTASFPYFSLLAAGAVRPLRRYRLIVDWHEVWSTAYWRAYLGPVRGRIGEQVQRRCARLQQRAFCRTAMHVRRLRELGMKGELTVLRGAYGGPLTKPQPRKADPLVVYAGRLIPEKRAAAVVPAVALAAERVPGLRGIVFGDGPDRARVEAAIAALGRDPCVSAPGFVAAQTMADALARALCIVLASEREGFGLIVVEAAAVGVPSVVAAGEDSAASELIESGVNGFVTESADPTELADAIVGVYAAGPRLRASTAAWFVANAPGLSVEHSMDVVLAAYANEARPGA